MGISFYIWSTDLLKILNFKKELYMLSKIIRYQIFTLVLSTFIFCEMKIGYLNVDKILSELDEVDKSI